MNDELRQFVMDYLNGHNSEEELALKFDLIKCGECLNYELEERNNVKPKVLVKVMKGNE